MTAAQPTCSSRRATIGSSVVYGRTTKPSSASCSAAARSPVVADDLELHPVRLERLPGQLGREHSLGRGEAAGRVRQHPDTAVGQQVEQRAPTAGVDPADRHRRHGRLRRDEHGVERGEARHPARAEQEPRRQNLTGDHQAVHVSSVPT
jgi:hypothetical protein